MCGSTERVKHIVMRIGKRFHACMTDRKADRARTLHSVRGCLRRTGVTEEGIGKGVEAIQEAIGVLVWREAEPTRIGRCKHGRFCDHVTGRRNDSGGDVKRNTERGSQLRCVSELQARPSLRAWNRGAKDSVSVQAGVLRIRACQM